MTQAKLGAMLLAIGIAPILLVNTQTSLSALYTRTEQIRFIDKHNFDLFPFPIVHDDDSTVEIVHGRELCMNDDGAIFLSQEQISNFKRLSPCDIKLPPVDGWAPAWLKVDICDDNSKSIDIKLSAMAASGRHRLHAKYKFEDDKLMLVYAQNEYPNRSALVYTACLTFSYLILGIILILMAITKQIWPRRKHPFSELHFDINRDAQSDKPSLGD
jgi:hypothetical protein